MQKQLEALSFLDRKKATKPKLVADQTPTVCGVTVVPDQVIAPVQQQTPGDHAPPCRIARKKNIIPSQLMKLQLCSSFT